MSPEKPSKHTKICPTCGTRVSVDAARCLVCGTDLSASDKTARSAKAVQGSRMPEITVGLPAALGLLALFLVIGAALVYFALQQTTPKSVVQVTPTASTTPTPTTTPSPTPVTPTVTFTPEPSPTPFTYIVKSGDLCGAIAFQFKVTVMSIVLANNMPADCGILIVGQKLLIPQPTPTPTPLPTATLGAAEATEAACEKIEITVQNNDTLSSISLNYQVPVDAIRKYNGLVNDVVRFGQKLLIPLCLRNQPAGPTPTPTLPPPYLPATLLLPADGTAFQTIEDIITLQWASVGTLRENESYAVTIEDITGGEGRKLVQYVTDTKFIVPADFRPADEQPHAMRWAVVPVRQTGTDSDGNPIWEPAGAPSAQRVFIWTGSGSAPSVPASTPTPKP
jgi:LysM repeat protein